MDTENQGEQYYQKQESLSQFINSQFLRKAVTKLIVSVSVFSLFFSHTTLISFLHYFKFYFSTLPLKLFSHTLDKNCTFLLCNGLLVFLAKYSGLLSVSSSPSPSNNNKSNLTVDHHESFKNYEDDPQPQMTIIETTTDEVPMTLEQEAELESTQTQQKQNAEEKESEAAITKTETEETREEQEKEEAEEESALLEEDGEEEAEAESSFFIEGEGGEGEEEEEEGGNGKLSDEELNKKFEDFIRKMKEELRIEARQQLIMV